MYSMEVLYLQMIPQSAMIVPMYHSGNKKSEMIVGGSAYMEHSQADLALGKIF